MQDVVKRIEFHVKPIVENLNLTLWGIEIQSGAKSVVRIFLENAGIDECTQVSRLVGLVLDVEEIFSNQWVLEVSTPGLDRTFFSFDQLAEYINDTLLVSLEKPIPSADKPRRKVQGVLTAINETSFILHLEDEDQDIEIEWDNVKRSKIIPYFEENVKPVNNKTK